MNMKNLLVLVSAVTLVTAAAAQSHQSLPELAKAEKARRAQLQKSGGAAKMYTEGDRSGGSSMTEGDATATPAVTGSGAPAGTAGKKKDKTPEELATEKQKEWDDKVKLAQDNIKNVQDAITRNERVLASMYNITPARQDVINNIEADKKKLVDLQASLVALEDERRRAGMPRR